MSQLIVKQSMGLSGEVEISGSKNAALPIMAASLLNGDNNKIKNIPNLSDIETMCMLLEESGAEIIRKNKELIINSGKIKNKISEKSPANKLRGSFLIAGPMLARTGKIKLPMPGGCPIGTRPIDLHLKGFAALGADISGGHGYVDVRAKKLKGAKIYLDFPSVGATENIMMAATAAEGTTVIENAATEPEIVDLSIFLNKQGANITGAGTDNVVINGNNGRKSVSYSIIPDRIEAGTFLVSFAMTKGKGVLKHVNPVHLKPVIAKLSEMGMKIEGVEDSLKVDASNVLHSADIKTMPFPGFPTDMQAPFSALMSITNGTGIVIETVFENRFLHIGELNRMGANIKIDGRTSVIEGVKGLTGAKVTAMDLRGGAALCLAGLTAKGETYIDGVEHIKRGYENFCDKLNKIGANIEYL